MCYDTIRITAEKHGRMKNKKSLLWFIQKLKSKKLKYLKWKKRLKNNRAHTGNKSFMIQIKKFLKKPKWKRISDFKKKQLQTYNWNSFCYKKNRYRRISLWGFRSFYPKVKLVEDASEDLLEESIALSKAIGGVKIKWI